MRCRRSITIHLVAMAGLIFAAAGCRSGESLANAGLERPAATQPPETSPPGTAAPGETLPPVETTAPPTTQPTKLDTLPKCDTHALDNVTGPVNITFWHGLSNELGTALQRLTDAYNASQTKVHVELQFQGGYEENVTKYLQSNTDNRPDLVQMPEYMVQQMIDTKSIVPTQACAESSGYDTSDFIPRALGAYATQGVQWSMPFNMSVPVLFYLKPRFTTAGLDPENPPQTLQELMDQGKQIVASGAATYSIALDSDFDGGGGWYVEQWLAKGGNFYADNENGRAAPATKVLYDGPAGLELMTYLQQLVQEGGAVYVGENASGQDTLLKLADAQAPAAMAISTSAALGVVLSVLGNGLIPGITVDQVGVGFMPGPDGGLGALVGGASLYIVDGKGADKAAAAWDYIQYLLTPQSQSQFASDTGYIPVRESALDLDPLKTVYTNDPRFKVAYDQLVGSKDAPTSDGPVIGPLQQVRKVTATAVATVLTGGDPQTALTTAAQQADDLIANYALQYPSG
jgi:sn-glycerol 3-phosphate transport system substrate-binding protein